MSLATICAFGNCSSSGITEFPEPDPSNFVLNLETRNGIANQHSEIGVLRICLMVVSRIFEESFRDADSLIRAFNFRNENPGELRISPAKVLQRR